MNAPSNRAETSALSDQPQYELAPMTNSASLILQGDAFERTMKFAEMMAKGKVTIPRHLQGNTGDCFAVALQAMQWRMNPFAVAQKTHVSPSGALGYEAQLISAVVTGSGAVDGDPEYEFLGDWDKILGKVEERQSTREGGGKYFVATYTKKDEEGLGVICRLRLKGEPKPRELKVMMSQCYPRFSTQWATDPMQQITFVAIRKWARRFKPGVILGVYADDEVEAGEPRFMGPADVVEPEKQAPATYPQAQFKENLPKWTQVIESGRKTADDLIAFIESTLPLTEDQKKELRAVKVKPKGSKAGAQDVEAKAKPDAAAQQATASDPGAGAPAVTFAQVADRIAKAIADKNQDALNEAGDLIGAVEDAGQRKELAAKYDAGVAELSTSN